MSKRCERLHVEDRKFVFVSCDRGVMGEWKGGRGPRPVVLILRSESRLYHAAAREEGAEDVCRGAMLRVKGDRRERQGSRGFKH